MAEETLLALVFANLWNPWLFILGKLGGYEAIALAVPVTLSMLILGSLTYFLLKFIVLAKILEKAGGMDDNKASNTLVLIISVAITFLSLYTGAALVLAGMIQAFGFIYALLLFFVLMIGLLLVTWRWGKGFKSGDFSAGGLFGGGSGINDPHTAPGQAGAHVSAVGAGHNATQGHLHSVHAIHDLDGLEQLIDSEHDAYMYIDKMLSNVHIFSSEENINKAIVFLKKIKTIAQNNPATRDLISTINLLKADIRHIQANDQKLQNAENLTLQNLSRAGYTNRRQNNQLIRELKRINVEIRGLIRTEQGLISAEGNILRHMKQRDKLLGELILLLGKKNMRRTLPKIKDHVRHLLIMTAPNGPIRTGLAQEETLIRECDTLFKEIKHMITRVDYINRQLNPTP